MTKRTLTALATIISLSLFQAKATERTHSLTLSAPNEPATLEVEIHTGSITVEGYAGKTVEIISNIKETPDDSFGDKRHKPGKSKSAPRSSDGLKSVKSRMTMLEIEEDENHIEITSELDSQFADIHVKVPFNTALELELYKGGDINISNISGVIEAEAYKGSIKANNISGQIVAETHMTDIVVDFSEDSAKVQPTGPSSLTSHSGNVDITVSKKSSSKVNVQSYKGEIFSGLASEFTSQEEVVTNNKGGKQKITVGGMMSASINGGKQEISLTTYNGNVYVRTK